MTVFKFVCIFGVMCTSFNVYWTKITKGMLKYVYVTIHVKCNVNCKIVEDLCDHVWFAIKV